MRILSDLGRCLTFLTLLSVATREDLTQLLADVDTVTRGFDWEWVLIRIESVEGPLSSADRFSKADPQIVVTALEAVEPSIIFDKPLSTFESSVALETNSPLWCVQ